MLKIVSYLWLEPYTRETVSLRFFSGEGLLCRFRKDGLKGPIRRVDSSTTSQFAEVYVLLSGLGGWHGHLSAVGYRRGAMVTVGAKDASSSIGGAYLKWSPPSIEGVNLRYSSSICFGDPQ